MSILTADKYYILRNIGILVFKLNLGQLVELHILYDKKSKYTDIVGYDYDSLYFYYDRSLC